VYISPPVGIALKKSPPTKRVRFFKLLKKVGFSGVRVNGSHHRLRHADGRVTTIPVHKNDPLPKGLLRKILRDDLEITIEELHKFL